MNIFFDPATLKRCGQNVIIGKTVRIRYPELVELGDNIILDDFCYISTALKIDSYVHICSGCKVIGGKQALVSVASFSSVGANVVLAAGSDDFVGGISSPLVPAEYKGDWQVGEIVIGRHCMVGPNSTVLPNVVFGDGAALGAQSLVKQNLEPWTLYAGVPARALRPRDRDKILALENAFMERERRAD